MRAYITKSKQLSGTNYSEVLKKAVKLHSNLKKQSKRRTYVRSQYFKKEKIFLDLFWHHLRDKFSHKEKTKRLKYYPCAIELIQKTIFLPTSKVNPSKNKEVLHRFAGLAPNGELFFVQIKENKAKKQKYLISVFPVN